MKRVVLAAFSALTLGALPARADSGPEALVRGVYEAYVAAETSGRDAPDQLRSRLYSARIQKQIAALKKACAKRQDLCLPDADFLVDGQDYRIRDIRTKLLSQGDGKAKVEARFRNFESDSRLTYLLVQEKGRWVVDDIDFGKGGGGLMEMLKPLPEQ